MTSEYTVQVEADTELDARDKARRRANDDGYRLRTVKRIVRVGPTPVSRQWAVTLAVVPL